MISAPALAQFERVGKALLLATTPALWRTDYNRAAGQAIALGMTCAAYARIQAGANPLDTLYQLEEFTEGWIGQWPGLSDLIARLTIEADA